jgi:uncharacterized OB-fold protein
MTTNEAEAARPSLWPNENELYRPYWEYARKREWRLQQCQTCGYFVHFPKPMCPRCSGSDLVWSRMSGKATVSSYIIVHHFARRAEDTFESEEPRPPSAQFDEPYVVAQVTPQEQESVRVACNILECDRDDVYVGMPVEVTFQDVTPEWTLPQFKPAPEAKLRSRGESPP